MTGHVIWMTVLLVVVVVVPVQAQKSTLPDIRTQQLAEITSTLGCSKPATPAARAGCAIAREFADAGKPDDHVLKDSSELKGRRWLGVTVVWGEPDLGAKEVRRSSPYLNLFLLGARYSDNFHQQVSFTNGYAPTHIAPTAEDEVPVVNSAVQALLNGKLDKTNAAVRFAQATELKFVPVQESSGKSLILGGTRTFLRQRNATLYMIDLPTSGKPKYRLSTLQLKDAL